ncbi:BnaA09g54490D [Brassica napus]|uniref:(rape) hypothetical protein n=1 Tax=Brassica napus TaxID=3708 RepID=A0A078JQ18_BRANA|nr:unnamed protein product [Brassica napus]CDY68545.1 BnaA09g54490D [Brassica napus]
MWGKGMRLEIHNNPLQRSVLVRIPSDFLRHKILDKKIWYPSLKRTCSSPTFSSAVRPKIHYHSSKPPHISPFPEIDPAKVKVISQSRQMITCELELPNCTPIIYSASSMHLILVMKELAFGLSS